MRRKSYIKLASIVLVVILLLYLCLSVKPFRRQNPLGALPEPDRKKALPYLLLVTKGDYLNNNGWVDGVSGWIRHISGSEGVYYLLQMARGARSVAFLATLDDGKVDFSSSMALSEKELSVLKQGKFPSGWKSFSERFKMVRRKKGSFNYLSISGENLQTALYATLCNELFLISSQLSSLQKMKDTLMGRAESFSVVWDLEPEWGSHFRIDDMGMSRRFIGDSAKGLKLSSPIVLDGAWESNQKSGILKWNIDGIFVEEKGVPHFKWNIPFSLPEPLAVAAGLNLVPLSGDILISGRGSFSLFEQIYRFLFRHPVVVSVGGTSEILTLPMSGVMVNVFDAGSEILKEVLPFDKKKKIISGDLENLPFSKYFNHSSDIMSVGVIDAEGLSPADLSGKILSDDTWENSLAWGYLDCNAVSGFIKNIIKLKKILSLKDDGRLKKLSMFLESAGIFTFIINDIQSGFFEWKK